MSVDAHSAEATDYCKLCRCVRCGARNPDLISGFIDTHKSICGGCAARLALLGLSVPDIFQYIAAQPNWADA